MAIDAVCPSGHRLIAADHRAGHTVPCPICQQELQLPPPAPLSPLGEGLGETRKLSGEMPFARQAPRNSTALSFSFDSSGTSDPVAQVPEQQPSGPIGLGPRDGTPPRGEARRAAEVAAVVDSSSSSLARANVDWTSRARRKTVYWLAVGLAVLTVVSLVPVAVGGHWDLPTSPGWARLLMMVAVVQFAYVVWMVTVPDWSSVWVLMIVFAIVASIYSLGLAVTLTASEADLDRIPLGVVEIHRDATWWCAAMLAANCVATYRCGRVSYVWHSQMQLSRRAMNVPVSVGSDMR